jgi:hypothetical protein
VEARTAAREARANLLELALHLAREVVLPGLELARARRREVRIVFQETGFIARTCAMATSPGFTSPAATAIERVQEVLRHGREVAAHETPRRAATNPAEYPLRALEVARHGLGLVVRHRLEPRDELLRALGPEVPLGEVDEARSSMSCAVCRMKGR